MKEKEKFMEGKRSFLNGMHLTAFVTSPALENVTGFTRQPQLRHACADRKA